MNNQKKVKSLIAFAILFAIALFVTVVIQIVFITKTKIKIAKQEDQIKQLEQQLDYYENKQPSEDYEVIT